MNKEQYVTYKTANLLKEKGFNWECLTRYDKPILSNNVSIFTEANAIDWNTYYYGSDYKFSALTQQMACRWLREEHNILVCILPCEVGAGVMDYTYCIYRIHADNYYFEPLMQGRISESINYEKTLEAGLEFVLKNII